MSSSAERLQSARFLIRVEDGAYSTRLLAGSTARGVRARVLGVLRWQRSIDAAISENLNRSLDRLDAEIRAALRIGVFEAVELGVPVAVATDGVVHLARRLGKSSASGLVNAVMRRTVPSWRRMMESATPDLQMSHPGWLYRRWASVFGSDAADSAMAAGQTPADVWVWWLGDDGRERVGDGDCGLVAHPWCPDAWTTRGGGGDLVEAVREGLAYAQDPSSQMVAHVASAIVPDGARMADLCAAPGGKSALWGRIGGDSVSLAMDRHLGRSLLMAPLLGRAGGGSIVVGDAALPPLRPNGWDLVLVDAPCTGTGTLRRHPELKWRLRPDSITEMASVQKKILVGGLGLVAPGGALLYSTCSVEPEENEALFHHVPDGFDRLDLTESPPEGVPWIPTDAGGIRILPCLEGDGFTLHALIKVE